MCTKFECEIESPSLSPSLFLVVSSLFFVFIYFGWIVELRIFALYLWQLFNEILIQSNMYLNVNVIVDSAEENSFKVYHCNLNSIDSRRRSI